MVALTCQPYHILLSIHSTSEYNRRYKYVIKQHLERPLKSPGNITATTGVYIYTALQGQKVVSVYL